MIHRHLVIPAGTPPAELPSVAILDILERGDLEDRRPLAVAIARAPDGDLARRVSKLIDEYLLNQFVQRLWLWKSVEAL